MILLQLIKRGNGCRYPSQSKQVRMKITDLITYPIKSCKGTHLTHAPCNVRGIEHDRSMMLVDGDGKFLTQRVLPRMALIAPTMFEDTLTLTAPGMQPLSAEVGDRGQTYKVVVWRSTCEAVDQGDLFGQWLSDFLDAKVRLMRMSDGHVRAVNPLFARQAGDQVGFADGYPYLLASEAALADLNLRLPAGVGPLPMDRFRPNIVIDGDPDQPYADDDWKDLQIGKLESGGMHFGNVKPCARCAVPTIDQSTGIPMGKEPTATLAKYRLQNSDVMFGQNLIALGTQTGVLKVGDELMINN